MSWSGYCGPCGKELLNRNVDGIHFKSGPEYQRQRFGMARALLGDELANALYAAGLFDSTLDATAG